MVTAVLLSPLQAVLGFWTACALVWCLQVLLMGLGATAVLRQLGPLLASGAVVVPTLFGIMVLNFFIVQAAPGGPVEQMVQKSGYFSRSAPANDTDLALIREMAELAVDSALAGTPGVIGHDEERGGEEVTRMTGRLPDGSVATVEIAPEGTRAANYGFDVTPARLITGFITERGVTPATPNALVTLYPEHRKDHAA